MAIILDNAAPQAGKITFPAAFDQDIKEHQAREKNNLWDKDPAFEAIDDQMVREIVEARRYTGFQKRSAFTGASYNHRILTNLERLLV